MTVRSEAAFGPEVLPKDVCIVTVTYADRSDLCGGLIAAAKGLGVGALVVVANGMAPDHVAKLKALSADCDCSKVVELKRNDGSAPGFAAGIEEALGAKRRYIWLLDDDNVPRSDALTELLKVLNDLPDRRAAPPVLFSARPARAYMRAILAGARPQVAYPTAGGYAGFNIVDVPHQILRRWRKHASGVNPLKVIPIPYGPYGGLLFDRELIRVVGLPNREMSLYEDDAEFTRRIARHRELLLVTSSIVTEADESWYEASKGRTAFGRVLLADSDRRAFYANRNRVYFESHYWQGNWWLRQFNKRLYVSALRMWSLFIGSGDRYRLLRDAMRRGDQGDLSGVELP
ncbi:glycosyltransferase [Actinomycetospora sp. C-140]